MTTRLPERAAADRLAATLVEERRAACDTPEIVTVAIVDGDPDYLRWIAESVDDPVAL